MKSINYGGVELKSYNSSDIRVPTSALEVKLPKSDKTALGLAIKDNKPCLLVGETGTGKTSAIRYLAYKLGAPYVRVNMSGFTTPDELIGQKSVKNGHTYYEHGVVTEAMLSGAILVLDEINATAPDCLFVLHGLLDDDRRITLPNGEIITPHPNFRVFATMNPEGYAGTRGLNHALLDRFSIILEVNHLSSSVESKLIQDRTGASVEISQKLSEIAKMLRQTYREQKLSIWLSTRALINVASLIVSGVDPEKSFIQVIANKTNIADERTAILDIFKLVWKQTNEQLDGEQEVIIKKSEIDRIKAKLEQVEILEKTSNELDRDNKALTDKLRLEQEQSEKLRQQLESVQTELQGLNALKDLIAKLGGTSC